MSLAIEVVEVGPDAADVLTALNADMQAVHVAADPVTPADAYGLVDQISVRPQNRRKRVAGVPMDAAREMLVREGIPQIKAEHWSFNTASVALLESQGLRAYAVNRQGPVVEKAAK